MPAGRPRSGGKETHPELAELAEWFSQSLAAAGYSNISKFLQQHAFEKNAIYEVMSGARFIPLERAKQLTAALGRDPLEVEPVWFRAKQRMELARRRKASDQPLTSWADLEQPEPSIQHLLVAQTQASELLPYGLPGLRAPLLSTVYVRQLLRDKRLARGSSDAEAPRSVEDSAGDDVLLADDVLIRHHHLLIIGEPGTGKSVFCREVARRLARIWLREDAADAPPVKQPVVPLVVPARALAAPGPFNSVLAAAVRDVYGIAMLTELRPEQLAHLVHRARWLLFVDGLDEIVDKTLRTKIIRAIAGHAQTDAPYQFVVTTRPLADLQLAPLREGHWAAYSLEPFGYAELRLFASRWFAAQEPGPGDGIADSFLREISDVRLRNVASSPLLATIAAVAKTLEPDRPLPLSRIDLYERFCRCLMDEDISGRTTFHQIRSQAGGAQNRIAEWLYSRRREMLSHLAEGYLQGESSLLAVAAEWIQQRLPDNFATIMLSRDDLRDMLVETGFFVPEGSGLRFFHQTLAEYLAAAVAAEKLPSVLPDLGAWVERGHDPAQRTFVIFTLLLWSRANGNLDLLLQDLMDGPPEYLLLAGRILGDCGDRKPVLTKQIVERMLNLGLGGASIIYQDNFDRDPSYKVDTRGDDAIVHPGEVFLILSRMFGDPFVASQLRKIARSGELATQTRIFATHALGRVVDSEEAITILLSLADDTSTAAELVEVVKTILALDSEAAHLVEPVLQRIITSSAESSVVIDAAQLMMRLGQPQLAVAAAWSIVRGPTTAAWCVRKAVQIILDHEDEAALEGLMGLRR